MPTPIEIQLHKQSRTLEIRFDDGVHATLSSEYLRVYSPSAEVRGHGAGQATLQTGKESVYIDTIEPVGNYAIRPIFSDGHDTGIYHWQYLHELSIQYSEKWQSYLDQLNEAGYSRSQ